MILTFELWRSERLPLLIWHLSSQFADCDNYQTRLSTNNSWCVECTWCYRRSISCSLLYKSPVLVTCFILIVISIEQQNLNFLFQVTTINRNILWLSDCLHTYNKNTWELNGIVSAAWCVYKVLCHVFICLVCSKCGRIWTECLIKMKCNS